MTNWGQTSPMNAQLDSLVWKEEPESQLTPLLGLQAAEAAQTSVSQGMQQLLFWAPDALVGGTGLWGVISPSSVVQAKSWLDCCPVWVCRVCSSPRWLFSKLLLVTRDTCE